ncbi:hypothetical protein HanRHA438_Chr02g0067281 [Helianthus annuus]|uniref:Uncharacterized protein n=1 Tax=Helianthus annuus TaxID=4232 RepID=A0A9K3JNI1_HELAN|nr:hypothetical protein HanXRQr2_Chr02g0066051 [Helianthus annuus]KAJ0604773.1 hypothetical protein HanHA300_Chr02g0054101 [Helianthus annuus]KAJ0615387.1 hypothetical protein HanIR_Chr02g0073501 [Helianthus annuus]KAJ0618788.1 hypothetical protein HanHA89_Chr02g0057551 [Helianthus annuus]KAJ0777248.1 hypothetical protein HanLR1_Chr02g0055211 [Helianthus annuus]
MNLLYLGLSVFLFFLNFSYYHFLRLFICANFVQMFQNLRCTNVQMNEEVAIKLGY